MMSLTLALMLHMHGVMLPNIVHPIIEVFNLHNVIGLEYCS